MKTVLLVDDNADDVFFMQIAIKKRYAGCHLRVVRNGQEAIDYLTGEGCYVDRTEFPLPSLLITDVKMPIKDGHELLQWIRGHETLRFMPVLVLTSSNQDQDIDLAYTNGANSYLVKPSSGKALAETVALAFTYWLTANTPPIISV